MLNKKSQKKLVNFLADGVVFRRKKSVQHEQELQIKCMNFTRERYPDELIFHIPNGRKRNKIDGGILKKMGVLAGVPDIFVAKQSKCLKYNGFFIELKAKRLNKNGKIVRNYPDDNQRKIIARLRELGYKAEVIDSFEDYTRELREYLG